ncbi:MAG: ester cyclase [Chitinophagaceae bacterium]
MKKLIYPLFIFTFALVACKSEKKTETPAITDKESTSPGKEERNKKIIEASMSGVNAHNADEALKDADPAFVDYGDGAQPPVRSKDSVKSIINSILNAFPDYKGENLVYVAEGDQVVVIGDWSGTFKKDMMGIKATNKSFKIKDVDIFKLNDDGKIIEHRAIYPFANILAGN